MSAEKDGSPASQAVPVFASDNYSCAGSAKTASGSVSGTRVYQALCRALSAVKAWGYFSISSTG
jgi:hypothetical protein